MLRFESQLNFMSMPLEKVKKSLLKILQQAMREAAREWLREWLKLGVPVETGMAKAAFKPLGRFLRVAVPISPTRKPYFSQLEGVEQSIDSGEDKSDFFLDTEGGVYTFYWETDILHYFHAEYYNGNYPPGEDVLVEAEKSFLIHMNYTLAKRLPQWAQTLFEVRTVNG